MMKPTKEHVTAEFDAVILQYMQPANEKPQQNAYDSATNTRKVVYVSGERTLNNIFAEGIDSSIWNSLKHN